MGPQQNVQHSGAWVAFTYASFGVSLFMLGVGLLYVPIDAWMKGYLAMAAAMMLQTCVTLTKTIRDVHEASRMVNRIEDAKTERLLMGIEGKS